MDWLESVIQYMRLGLELGLPYTLLSRIRQEEGRKVDDCKRTLLQSWLERADRVDEMGGTNKPALVATLRRMGEHRVADKIIPGLRCGCIYSQYVIQCIACMDNKIIYVSCRFRYSASCS